MAFDFHKDKQTYIKYQYENANKYVIPFIERKLALNSASEVMEIGCAEGGVLQAFLDIGCKGVGVELQPARYEMAKALLNDYIAKSQVEVINKNIYDLDVDSAYQNRFDLIILKDVIEHIHDQDKVLGFLRKLLKKDGHIFFGFPPWQMPYGGHQQVAKSKLLSKLPYYHLLPMKIYKGLLKSMGERDVIVDNLAEIKETGISIERFEKLLKKNAYSLREKEFYLINPIYKYKFNVKAKTQYSWISAIPYFRNFLTTCVYYLVKKEELPKA